MGRFALKSFSLILMAALVWPLLYSVWLSFTPSEFMEPPISEWSLQWYSRFFADTRWMASLLTSFKIGLLCVFLALLVTIATTLYERRFGLPLLLKAAIMIPFLMPPVVLAMGLLPWMHILGLWGKSLSLGLSHALIAFPIAYLIVRDGYQACPHELELAAQSLGASPLKIWLKITLPLLAPSLLVAALIAMIISMNEYILALFLAAPDLETLPTVIWPNLRYSLTPVVAAASSVSLTSTLILMILGGWLFRLPSKGLRV